jgi:hypothetical protein
MNDYSRLESSRNWKGPLQDPQVVLRKDFLADPEPGPDIEVTRQQGAGSADDLA